MKKVFLVFLIVAMFLAGCSGNAAPKETVIEDVKEEIIRENLFNKTYFNARNRSNDYFPFMKFITNLKENAGELSVGFVNQMGRLDTENDIVESYDLLGKTMEYLDINDLAVCLVHFMEDGKIYYSSNVMSSNFLRNNNSGVFSYDIDTDTVEKIIDLECTNGYFVKNDDGYYAYGTKIEYKDKVGEDFDLVRPLGHYRYDLQGKLLNDYSEVDDIRLITGEDKEIYFLTHDNKLYKSDPDVQNKTLIYDFKDKTIDGGLIVEKGKIYLIETYDYKVIDGGGSKILTLPLSQILMIDKDTKELISINYGEKMVFKLASSENNIYFSGREVNDKMINTIKQEIEALSPSDNFEAANLLVQTDFGPSNLYKITKENTVQKICPIKDVDITAGPDKVYYYKPNDRFIDSVIHRLENGELSIGMYNE
jgi:hypothetical protein